MKIYAGSDHAGLALKDSLCAALTAGGHEVIDLGTKSEDVTDYPDWAARVARAVRGDATAKGLIVCGSGVGVSIVANKIPGIRAVDAWNVESARLSREHNDANVLCLGQRMVPDAEAKAIVEAWIGASFEGGRHVRRLVKIAALERAEGFEVATRRELEALVKSRAASRLVATAPTWFTNARALPAPLRSDAGDNPGLALAAFFITLERLGRPKLMLVVGASATAATRVRQLFDDPATGIGKFLGLEIVEAKADPGWSDPERHQDDRGFLVLVDGKSPPDVRAIDGLLMAGHPLVELAGDDVDATVVRLEFAIAAAASKLSVSSGGAPSRAASGSAESLSKE